MSADTHICRSFWTVSLFLFDVRTCKELSCWKRFWKNFVHCLMSLCDVAFIATRVLCEICTMTDKNFATDMMRTYLNRLKTSLFCVGYKPLLLDGTNKIVFFWIVLDRKSCILWNPHSGNNGSSSCFCFQSLSEVLLQLSYLMGNFSIKLTRNITWCQCHNSA